MQCIGTIAKGVVIMNVADSPQDKDWQCQETDSSLKTMMMMICVRNALVFVKVQWLVGELIKGA